LHGAFATVVPAASIDARRLRGCGHLRRSTSARLRQVPEDEPVSSTDWDLAIVGAGPAGTAAALGALTANPSLRVVLIDRADFPRDKACGDGVAPHVLDVLAEVGVTGLLADRVPVRDLVLEHGASSVRRTMARPAWVVPRTLLDHRLVEAAVASGATLLRRRVRSLRVATRSVVLDGDLHAKLVVGADGAHSSVRAAAGLPPVRRRALALRGYAPTPADREGQQAIVFGDGPQPSYAWSFDRGDGRSNIGYGELLTPSGRPPSRALLLQRLERLLPGATTGAGDWLGHHLPLSSWRWHQPDGRVLLAGDAAGLVNPLSGEGIYYAVATGVLAGRCAADALGIGCEDRAGTAHRRAVRALLGRHLRHTAAASRLVSLPAVVTAAVSAAGRDQLVFDDLVEIGLGRGLVRRRTVRALVRSAAGSTR
jgi:geranylgeranyl reductase family protein